MVSLPASPAPAVIDPGIQQHKYVQSIALHLIPGILGTLFYVLMAPIAMRSGFPPLFVIYLAILVIITFELGYLLYVGQRKNQRLSLQGVILYREPISKWQYVLWVPLLIFWAILATALLMPIDNAFASTLFAGLPDWYLFQDISQYGARYQRSVLLATMLLGILLNGLVGPIIEELYFRGFLLPRLARLGYWAPIINAVLFSAYHFWTPWQFFSRLLVNFGWAYFAYRKRNIYVGILVHCLLNLISLASTFVFVLG